MTPLIMTVAGVAILLVVLAYYRVWRTAVRPRPPNPRQEDYPSVTVIRPIRGLDWGIQGNLEAALADQYPGALETLFVFDSPEEPAVELAHRAIANIDMVPGTRSARVIFCGAPPPGRTGKLNAMLTGLGEATGRLIAFCDSDVRVDGVALTRLVDTLYLKPRTGSAFAPVVVTTPPETLGDAGYALLLNGLYGPVTAAVADRSDGELPFIMGQFMVMTRPAIARIGGLEALDGQLVDDMHIGALMREQGLSNRVSPHPVAILQKGLSLGEFWSVYRRWITFSRSGLPGWGFRIHAAVPVAFYWASLVLAAAAFAMGWWLAGLVNLITPATVTWIYANLHRAFGGARLGPVNRWASLVVLLMAPVVFVASLVVRTVTWRGHTYTLGSDARLSGDSHSQ